MKVIITLLIVITGFLSWGQEKVGTIKEEGNSKGFYNRVNLGVLGGGNSFGSFNIINGYCFNEHWSGGLGLGVERLIWEEHIPVFIEGNYNFLKAKTSPWLNAMIGYEVPYSGFNQEKGGLTFGGKIGFSYYITDHFGISTSIGYRYIHLSRESNGNFWEPISPPVVMHQTFNRYEFRVGLVFK